MASYQTCLYATFDMISSELHYVLFVATRGTSLLPEAGYAFSIFAILKYCNLFFTYQFHNSQKSKSECLGTAEYHLDCHPYQFLFASKSDSLSKVTGLSLRLRFQLHHWEFILKTT